MNCPYCHTEYSAEKPCFCQPPAPQQKTARELYYTRSVAEEPVCLNSHRGARLD